MSLFLLCEPTRSDYWMRILWKGQRENDRHLWMASEKGTQTRVLATLRRVEWVGTAVSVYLPPGNWDFPSPTQQGQRGWETAEAGVLEALWKMSSYGQILALGSWLPSLPSWTDLQGHSVILPDSKGAGRWGSETNLLLVGEVYLRAWSLPACPSYLPPSLILSTTLWRRHLDYFYRGRVLGLCPAPPSWHLV